MRNNNRKYTSKKRVARGTPLCINLNVALLSQKAIVVDDRWQKVVDSSIVSGGSVVEFYLLKNRMTTQGNNQLTDNNKD